MPGEILDPEDLYEGSDDEDFPVNAEEVHIMLNTVRKITCEAD